MILCDTCSPRKQCTADKSRTECKYYQPMTNEEWIKSANTEQLAEWLKKHMNCNFCPMNLKCEDMRDCMEHIKVWLKQPHTIEVVK